MKKNKMPKTEEICKLLIERYGHSYSEYVLKAEINGRNPVPQKEWNDMVTAFKTGIKNTYLEKKYSNIFI